MTASTTLKKILKIAAPAIFWLGLWQCVSTVLGKPLLLPSPLKVARTLWALAGAGRFWRFTGATLARILSGTLLGVAAGVILAAATHFVKAADILLSPALRVLRATPVVSFIVLIILWTGSNYVPVAVCALMVTPVVWENLRAGLASPDGALLEMARAYTMGPGRRLRYIYVPAALPYLRSGVLSSMGLAWKSGVAAEVLCIPREAIGTQIYWSKLYLEVPELFAWTVVVAALSMALEYAARRALMRGGDRDAD